MTKVRYKEPVRKNGKTSLVTNRRRSREVSSPLAGAVPEVFLRTADDVTLHFGCRVSEDKVSVLWSCENVCLEFGRGLRSLNFFFSYESLHRKFELSFESVWHIELRRPRGDPPMKFLLLQLRGAPKIYRKKADETYFMRDVDFTPFCSIGQSSAMCLEIPNAFQIPNLRHGSASYEENEARFVLEKRMYYLSSAYLGLVPTVVPPEGANLPYKILFKLNSLVQQGFLAIEAINESFFKLLDVARVDPEMIYSALERMSHLKHCCYEPRRWLKTQYTGSGENCLGKPDITLPEGLVYVHRVQITPTKVCFCGPEVNLSNRVLRNYPDQIDNFLRVSFVDEDLERLHSQDLSHFPKRSYRTKIYNRILHILRNGLVIGDKKFEFLAFSTSQLRESSVWMFALSDDKLTAADIRNWMGDFCQIRNVAKYAARLGQSFASSRETLRVGDDEVDLIPDIGNKYCFSDGIGKISKDLAKKVAEKCGLGDSIPSAFQIRYGGFKGVVAVDPGSLAGLSLRNSMSKYRSEDRSLDVLAWSKPLPCYLNRQLIMLLSTLGVEDRVFVKKQREAEVRLEAMLGDRARARDELRAMFPGEVGEVLEAMLSCGYKPEREPFLSAMMTTMRASKLGEIRNKTRVYVEHGRAMMGCLDETGVLEYGQVFVQCSHRQHSGSKTQKPFIVKGNLVVGKNPCLHPGDLRVLRAIDVPELRHMVDCIVFPQKGMRPHPNECSGSDLDGDIYFVCWDRDLIPPRQAEAMDYTSSPVTQLDHDVTIEEVQEYFVDYVLNNNMGIISNTHTVFADRTPERARSKQCVELAKLFSIAVDFPKTGVVAKIPTRLRAKEYPDFMAKKDKPSYKSNHVIGKLFREVQAAAEERSCSIKPFTIEMATKFYDVDMEVNGFKNYLSDAFDRKTEYDYKLGNLMEYYGIKTEAELLSGNVVNKSRRYDKSRDMESVKYSVKSLIAEAKMWFEDRGGSESKISGSFSEEEYAKKASAWYHVTYHPYFWGHYNEDLGRDHFMSFPWCVSDRLIAIKRRAFSRNSSRSYRR